MIFKLRTAYLQGIVYQFLTLHFVKSFNPNRERMEFQLSNCRFLL
jgi:hypothetical protein